MAIAHRMIEAIYLSDAAGGGMTAVPEVLVTPDGLAGDRYAAGAGTFSGRYPHEGRGRLAHRHRGGGRLPRRDPPAEPRHPRRRPAGAGRADVLYRRGDPPRRAAVSAVRAAGPPDRPRRPPPAPPPRRPAVRRRDAGSGPCRRCHRSHGMSGAICRSRKPVPPRPRESLRSSHGFTLLRVLQNHWGTRRPRPFGRLSMSIRTRLLGTSFPAFIRSAGSNAAFTSSNAASVWPSKR